MLTIALTDSPLIPGAEALERHGIRLAAAEAADIRIVTEKREKGLQVIWKGQEAQIAFSRRVEFFRGLSLLLEAWEQGKRALECVEQPAFRFNGYMMDCSRNAVPTVETVKEMVRMMALMGLDSLQLYTEDVYELEGEPYFWLYARPLYRGGAAGNR